MKKKFLILLMVALALCAAVSLSGQAEEQRLKPIRPVPEDVQRLIQVASEEIGYDDIDYHLTSNMSFQELIDDQDYYLWPITYIRSTLIETMQGFAYDKAKLEQKMKELNFDHKKLVGISTDGASSMSSGNEGLRRLKGKKL